MRVVLTVRMLEFIRWGVGIPNVTDSWVAVALCFSLFLMCTDTRLGRCADSYLVCFISCLFVLCIALDTLFYRLLFSPKYAIENSTVNKWGATTTTRHVSNISVTINCSSTHTIIPSGLPLWMLYCAPPLSGAVHSAKTSQKIWEKQHGPLPINTQTGRQIGLNSGFSLSFIFCPIYQANTSKSMGTKSVVQPRNVKRETHMCFKTPRRCANRCIPTGREKARDKPYMECSVLFPSHALGVITSAVAAGTWVFFRLDHGSLSAPQNQPFCVFLKKDKRCPGRCFCWPHMHRVIVVVTIYVCTML